MEIRQSYGAARLIQPSRQQPAKESNIALTTAIHRWSAEIIAQRKERTDQPKGDSDPFEPVQTPSK